MTKRTWAGTCGAIVAAASVAVLAQTQTQPPPPQPSAASADQVTVTGCLRAAPGSAAETGAATAGTTGTTGTAAATPTDADAKFVLTNATLGAAAPPSSETAAGATGTAGAAAAGSSQATADHGQTYRLVANAASLSPHVGKKLELTGTLVNPSGPTSSAAASSPSDAPALRVEKGKVIAASCDEK